METLLAIKKRLSATLYLKPLLLAIGFLMMGSIAMAQTQISGTVTDAGNGETLAGAYIIIEGTTTGASTDGDGQYTIMVSPTDKLIFSFIGFTSISETVGDRTIINVNLEAGTLLDEVVVTGYGTQRSKEVTGSIASVKEKDFNKGAINDPAQLLQGKVAGLTITSQGADPNGSFTIRNRGLSTVGASSEPLIVIDGVLGADMNSVDPNDIASMEVLKDGSAAAIYGTRGASGVILITTKKGRPGTSVVNYSGQFSVSLKDRVVDVLSPQQYRDFPGSSDLGGDINWIDEITRTGMSTVHNLSLSGGTGSTSYRISANYRGVQGIAINTGFQQMNGRVNLQQKALKDKLTFTLNLANTTRDSKIGNNEAFKQAVIYNPTTPYVRDLNDPAMERYGGYHETVLFDYFNPVSILEQNTWEQQTNTLTANIRGDYDITNGLRVGLFYSLQRDNNAYGAYSNKTSRWSGGDRNGLATKRNAENQDQLFRFEANYDNTFGNNIGLKLLAAYEYQDFTFQGFSATGGDFLTDAFGYNNLSAAGEFNKGLGSVDSYKNTYKLIAFFGRANLNFNNKVFATASIRREGSSRFGADEKWGWFPAISAGVDLVETFGIGAFNNLKLRAGYGVTGNNVGESYLSLQRFGPTGNFYYNGEFVPSYGPVANANESLKWETKSDINIGVDFALLDFKLTGTVDYYTTKTEDLIMHFAVPIPPNLYSRTWLNIGEMQNSGIELTMGYIIDLGDKSSWRIGFTANKFFDTELVSLSDEARGLDFGGSQQRSNLGSPGQNGTNMILLEEGAPIGQIWTLRVDPDNRVNADGGWNILDTDGSGDIDALLDREVVGNGLPSFQLGLNNSFSFGHLDVNIFFRGTFGHDLLNTFRAFYEAPSTINTYNILSSSYDIADLTDQPLLNDSHVEKANFVKLDNMSVGYTIPMKKSSGISEIRLALTGQNLLTFTNYSGISPEPRLVDVGENDSGSDALSPGIDRRNSYFTARTYSIGLNLVF